MIRDPGLTVVILTYDSAATVGSCLEALAAQDNPDFDVVVVDDDSRDGTLDVVRGFASSLRLTVTRNGSHSIPRGRNLGLDTARTEWVAFIDSDDRPAPDWTRVVAETFRADPGLALISGTRLPSYRTRTARAIALNDEAVRRLAGGGVMQFAAGNSAINRRAWPQARFDEEFPAAEDLEIVSRIEGRYRWTFVPHLRIHYYSRGTLRGYAAQMYRYGYMKQLFAFAFGTYRPLDYVPLGLLAAGAVAAAVLGTWWPLLLLVPFSLLEAAFVVAFQRCGPVTAGLTFPAWLVKNVAWSYGIVHGAARLVLDGGLRGRLRAKRVS